MEKESQSNRPKTPFQLTNMPLKLKIRSVYDNKRTIKQRQQNKATDPKRDTKDVLPARLRNGQGEGRNLQEPI